MFEYDEGQEPELFKLIKAFRPGGCAHAYLVRVIDEYWVRKYGADEVVIKVPYYGKRAALIDEVGVNAGLFMHLRFLESPNLCRYLGFNIFRGQPVMVMEYCRGGSLRDVLGDPGRQKRLSIDRTLQIASGVLSGLIVIHHERIFHRDIKPENILMGEDGTPKISDFGISKMLVSKDRASSTVGTLPYMSPEMLGREGAAFTSDIWSLGVTLYEMVTGQWPFGDEETPPGVMVDLIRKEVPAKPRDLCEGVPRWLSDLIETSLQKRASDRFCSAEEMLGALTRRGLDDSQKELAEVRELLKTDQTGPQVEIRICQLVEKHPKMAEAHACLGQYYRRCQRLREAVEAFSRATSLDPANAQFHWDSALVYQGIGQRQDAIQHIEKALSLNLDAKLRQHAATLLKALQAGRGKPATRESADPAQKRERFERVLAEVRELINRDDCDRRAADELRRLVNEFLDNPRAYQHLGEYYNRCQMYPEAIEVFRKGIELDGNNALLHWDLALAYHRMGSKADAEKHLEKAMSLDLDPGLRQYAATLLKTLRSGRDK